MDSKTPLIVGMQVAYIPNHVREASDGKTAKLFEHADTEYGFVTSWNEETVFVRFWSKYIPIAIRTVANSEGCSYADLEPFNSHSVQEVEEVIERMRSNPDMYGWREQAVTVNKAAVEFLLNTYSGNIELVNSLNRKKQERIEELIPDSVKLLIAEIEAEFEPQIAEANKRAQELAERIKADVIVAKETISGE